MVPYFAEKLVPSSKKIYTRNASNGAESFFQHQTFGLQKSSQDKAAVNRCPLCIFRRV